VKGEADEVDPGEGGVEGVEVGTRDSVLAEDGPSLGRLEGHDREAVQAGFADEGAEHSNEVVDLGGVKRTGRKASTPGAR
jgi:hypothetical protein